MYSALVDLAQEVSEHLYDDEGHHYKVRWLKEDLLRLSRLDPFKQNIGY